MSASQEIYGGLAWIGRTEAKVFFVVVLSFYVLFTIIFLVQLFSALHILRNTNNYSAKQVQDAQRKKNALLIAFLIITFIFGVLLFLAYWFMKETQKNKQAAAAAGALDVLDDFRGFRL